MSFQQTAIVTGSTSGIGLEIARQLAETGYNVVTNGTRAANQVPKKIQLPNTHYVQGDIGDPATSMKLVEETYRRFGKNLGPLVVVANAGVEVADTDSADRVEAMIRTNQEGPEHLFRAAASDLMRHERSLFVAVGSIVGTLGIILPGNKNYQATKVAVEAMVRGVVANFVGVHAITLSPGAIATPMTQGSPVYGLLFRLVAMAAVSDDEFRQGLIDYLKRYSEDNDLGIHPQYIGKNAGEIFSNMLATEQTALSCNPAAETLAKVLKKFPSMEGNTAMILAAKTAQHQPTQEWMAKILKALDVLVSPAMVARTLIDEIQNRRVPDGGVLRAFQSGSRAVSPIERLFCTQA